MDMGMPSLFFISFIKCDPKNPEPPVTAIRFPLIFIVFFCLFLSF